MGYHLGIDLGTTYTAAARERDGRVDMVSLGGNSPSAPSVMFLNDDGSMSIGETANRMGASRPGRVVREFKRRLGDPTPIMLGGSGYAAEGLMGHLLRWVVSTASTVEGGPPDGVALTHPANWGEYKQGLLRGAAADAGIEPVVLLTEPQAAAIHYASHARVEPGSVVAVYDLGGGTFDAAILRKEAAGFSVLGDPEGIERLGGIDIDQAVFGHVAEALGGALEELDPDDDDALAAVARLRSECVAAKEALSVDTEATVPVLLPNVSTEVRITRGELETMIRPSLHETVSALHRAMRSAGVEGGQVSAVLLVGGSSRVPLVAQMVSSELGRPVAVDAHPKHAIALGAAIAATPNAERFTAAAAATGGGGGSVVAAPEPAVPQPTPPAPVETPAASPSSGPPPAAPAPTAPGPPVPANAPTPVPVPQPTAPPAPTMAPGSEPPTGLPVAPVATPLPSPAPPPVTPPGAAPPPAFPQGVSVPVPPLGSPAGPPPGSRPAPSYQPPGTGPLPPGSPQLQGDAAKQATKGKKGKKVLVTVVLLLLVAVAVVVGLALLSGEDDGTVAIRELTPAACVDQAEPSGNNFAQVTQVSCDQEHDGEYIAQVESPEFGQSTVFPGAEALTADIEQRCLDVMATFFGGDPANAAAAVLALEVELFPVVPTPEQWESGTRGTACVLAKDGEGTLTGTLKDQGDAAG